MYYSSKKIFLIYRVITYIVPDTGASAIHDIRAGLKFYKRAWRRATRNFYSRPNYNWGHNVFVLGDKIFSPSISDLYFYVRGVPV
jgi:hypothetical protein